MIHQLLTRIPAAYGTLDKKKIVSTRILLSGAALLAKENSFCMVKHQKMRTTNIALPAAQ